MFHCSVRRVPLLDYTECSTDRLYSVLQCSVILRVPVLDHTECYSALLYRCPSVTDTCVAPISCCVVNVVPTYYVPKPWYVYVGIVIVDT
jgi:hypothetical protein